ncbi:hypothetical protein [Methylocystis echinoides]|nr:hypothetical protein [Methylocystis echinoides]
MKDLQDSIKANKQAFLDLASDAKGVFPDASDRNSKLAGCLAEIVIERSKHFEPKRGEIAASIEGALASGVAPGGEASAMSRREMQAHIRSYLQRPLSDFLRSNPQLKATNMRRLGDALAGNQPALQSGVKLVFEGLRALIRQYLPLIRDNSLLRRESALEEHIDRSEAMSALRARDDKAYGETAGKILRAELMQVLTEIEKLSDGEKEEYFVEALTNDLLQGGIFTSEQKNEVFNRIRSSIRGDALASSPLSITRGSVQSAPPKQLSPAEARMFGLVAGRYAELQKKLAGLSNVEFKNALMKEHAALASLISDFGKVPKGADMATVLSNALISVNGLPGFERVDDIPDSEREAHAEIVREALANLQKRPASVDIENLARQYIKGGVSVEKDHEKWIKSLREKETLLESLLPPERLEQETRMRLLGLDEMVSGKEEGAYTTADKKFGEAGDYDKFQNVAEDYGPQLAALASNGAKILRGVDRAVVEQDVADWFARRAAIKHNEPVETERKFYQIILDAMRSNH